jgi:hypothetical protein
MIYQHQGLEHIREAINLENEASPGVSAPRTSFGQILVRAKSVAAEKSVSV